MACSTTNQNVVMELEDLFISKRDDIEIIRKNLHKYKKMIFEIIEWSDKNLNSKYRSKNFHKYYSNLSRKYRIYSSKSILVYTYRFMIENNEIENKPEIWQLIQKRPCRNLSGVTIITVLTSPHPDGQDFSCKHNCYYCPNEPGQPRSYLKKEPAVARANRNKFDPILQMEDRIHSLMVNGHEIDKLEIIIEGGTYTEYPPQYLERFHRDLIYCANTYFDTEKREPLSVDEEVAFNETARIKIIGICIETRPDVLLEEDGELWLRRFRQWGVTRVQLGVQHTNNSILKKVNRGHTIEQAEEAITLLKDNCFKVDIHLMPDLPFSNPEEDIKMFDYVFNGVEEEQEQTQTQSTTTKQQKEKKVIYKVHADQAKIYTCQVTPWTVIEQWHKSGKYKPYAQTNERALLDVVKYAMINCPPWMRLPRVVRDIPLTYVQGGNMYPNLRQMLTDEIKKEGNVTMDIRARECGRNPEYDINEGQFYVIDYNTPNGTEYFISFESTDRMCLFGFLRLRIPNNYENCKFDCLLNKGFIREIHVYGNLVPVGFKKNGDSQHKGIGKHMILIAKQICIEQNRNGMAVIPGIGVTGYYKKLGFKNEHSYHVYHINNHFKKIINDINNYDSAIMDMYICIIVISIYIMFVISELYK